MAKINKTFADPEIWGGIECTINRCYNDYRDQLQLSKHYDRPGDLEAFAELGIKSIRYPVLWEKHCAGQNGVIDWTWSSRQLSCIKKLGMEPIVGLVHHGSGPLSTSLVDRDFPVLLAAYARKVALQFPWIKYYTPVNEPLTTARFSGLYGIWYPHRNNEFDFLSMLLNQLEAVVLSMKAIREINPSAQLVQTEDIGKTHSTPLLKYQADFENQRRWLTYDLLCGKVDQLHPLWNYFIENGIDRARLYFFIENQCPPDIAGFNYYVTSERFLDEEPGIYPSCLRGSNGRHEYADNVAVRVMKPAGIGNLLTEAWKRYHLPMAITEAHLNCTREDQLRWFKEIWDNCCRLIKKGIDIRAVTAWSLLGAYDWDSLLINQAGHYETGVFDISSKNRRPTAMVKLIKSLTVSGTYEHPLLEGKGWWHRHNPAMGDIEKPQTDSAPLLIIGNGSLARALTIACDQRGIRYKIFSRSHIDITDSVSIEKVFARYKPWAVINATGFTNLDTAELKVTECYSVNTLAPALIADECKRKGLLFLTFSTDMVFNGNKRVPYMESDETVPLNVYGKSKAMGETAVLSACPQALIIRTSAFFGPWDQNHFVFDVMNTLEQHGSYQAAEDIIVSPTYLPDLVHSSLDLLIDEATGTWHLSNEGSLSWSDFAKEIALTSGYSGNKIVPKTAAEMNWKARRPHYSVLKSEKGIKLPALNNALERYFSGKPLPSRRNVPVLL